MAKWKKEALSEIVRIKALAMDVDGVLTDGSIIWDSAGRESKVFNAKDGLGLSLAKTAGFYLIWITGRESLVVKIRAEELGVDVLLQGAREKGRVLLEACERLNISPREVAYIGDDLNDLPVLEMVGLRIAVGDAVEEVKGKAELVLDKEGGKGAVREAVEEILKKRGIYEETVQRFLKGLEG